MDYRKRPCTLGLIGGIGSGKSRVAAELARRGARVLNADGFGHEALRQPEIRQALVARWGPGILKKDGDIDRRRVAAIVFADSVERQVLEGQVFPFIEKRIHDELDRAAADCGIGLVVLDAAIMLETGWDRCCDRIIYVHTPWRVRLQRLQAARGWSEKEVRERARAQLPLTEKVTRADFVIDNTAGEHYLQNQVDKMLEQLHNLNYNASPKSSH
jgi:dephospho-CoA kinase